MDRVSNDHIGCRGVKLAVLRYEVPFILSRFKTRPKRGVNREAVEIITLSLTRSYVTRKFKSLKTLVPFTYVDLNHFNLGKGDCSEMLRSCSKAEGEHQPMFPESASTHL